MDKRIIYTNIDGSLSVIIPSPKWEGSIEELAEKDVPKVDVVQLPWRIVDVSALPKSRNWRNAWTDKNPTETVDIDLEKAKDVHKNLIIDKAKERVVKDEFGVQDFSVVKAELDSLDFDSVENLDELYNLWTPSIDVRKEKRKYEIHK